MSFLSIKFQRYLSKMSVSPTLTRLVCDAYREAAKTPALVSAFMEMSSTSSSPLISVNTRWSQTNLSTNTKVTYSKMMMLDRTSMDLVHESHGVADTGVEMMTVKDDMIVKVRTAANKEDCQNIELWNRIDGLVATFNMKDVDKHAKIYTDAEFGSLQLSTDKKTLFYIAEEKKEKNVPFLSQGALKEDAIMGGEYQ